MRIWFKIKISSVKLIDRRKIARVPVSCSFHAAILCKTTRCLTRWVPLLPTDLTAGGCLCKAFMQILDDIGRFIHPLDITQFICDFKAGHLDLASTLQ